MLNDCCAKSEQRSLKALESKIQNLSKIYLKAMTKKNNSKFPSLDRVMTP